MKWYGSLRSVVVIINEYVCATVLAYSTRSSTAYVQCVPEGHTSELCT